MAYYRRRYTRRVSRRRGRRTLSSYHIATRTSARSQAKQIYALNRRVSRIQRLTKPEIVTIQRSASEITDLNRLNNNIQWITEGNSTSNFAIVPLGPVSDTNSGSGTAPVVNNFARLQSFTLYGNFQYSELVTAPTPQTLRIVIVQTKATRGSTLTSSDIFTGGEPGANPFNATFGPLQTGVSRTCKILSDKRYYLDFQHPNVTIQTRLRYLRPYYRDTTSSSSGSGSSESIPKGAIFVFWSHYSNEITLTDTAAVNFMYKLAYTDA